MPTFQENIAKTYAASNKMSLLINKNESFLYVNDNDNGII